jgi:hypothetical protein
MKKSIEIQAPNLIPSKKVFLAGSIEMGKAEMWQNKIITELDEKAYIFINPRRDDWDSSWEQDILNPNFYEQVNWELDSLEVADIILFYFDPNTMSPISLLELGLHARSNKVIVCCPKGFWRKGNVDIVCHKYGIPFSDSLDDLIEFWDGYLEQLKNRI